MKSILILILGCLPLSVLTVWSFVELGSIDAELERGTWEEDGGARPAVPNIPPVAPFVEELAEADFFSGAVPASLGQLPEESRFAPLKESWPKWTAARQTVARFLQIERLTRASTSQPFDQTRLEDLETAEGRLEESRRAHEALKEKYQALKEECQESSARGAGPLAALADRRIAELDRRIEQCRKRLEAASLLSDARAAFARGQYAQCVSGCDQLLSGHTSAMTASVLGKVRILRRRAEFWRDVEQLYALLNEHITLERREDLLQGFLDKYADRDSRTVAERRVTDQCEQRLLDVKNQLKEQAESRAAAGRIRQLKDHPPDDFGERVRRITAILHDYPTPAVQNMLRALAIGWLTERLPLKRIDEPGMLQEAEMREDRVVRGYFKEVRDSDGTLLGYKCYPTFEQLLNPIADVGTYRKEDLLILPGPSVPRRCVTRFNEARDRLLEAPNRRASWVELADLCESLEAELDGYRTKKGASPEAPNLSFQEAGRFARELLDRSGWADLETLFGRR